MQAIDIPGKTNGTARYGIDAAVEGMVYARPKIPPTRYGARVRSIDDFAAKKIRGYIGSLALEDPSNTVPGWVMVIADSYPAAFGQPISSRSIGRQATPSTSPSRTFSITAQCRSQIRMVAFLW